jgi:hypothetical protein
MAAKTLKALKVRFIPNPPPVRFTRTPFLPFLLGRNPYPHRSCDRVLAAFLAAIVRLLAPRRRAADLACLESAR